MYLYAVYMFTVVEKYRSAVSSACRAAVGELIQALTSSFYYWNNVVLYRRTCYNSNKNNGIDEISKCAHKSRSVTLTFCVS